MDLRGMTRRSWGAAVAMPFVFFVFPTFGADITLHAEGETRLAIEGFDIVTYHTEGRAMRGKIEYQTVWHDARWQFASRENLDLFVANPAKYAEHHDDPIDAR